MEGIWRGSYQACCILRTYLDPLGMKSEAVLSLFDVTLSWLKDPSMPKPLTARRPWNSEPFLSRRGHVVIVTNPSFHQHESSAPKGLQSITWKLPSKILMCDITWPWLDHPCKPYLWSYWKQVLPRMKIVKHWNGEWLRPCHRDIMPKRQPKQQT